MNKLVQHISIRVLLLVGILLGTGFIYQQYLYDIDLKNQSPIADDIEELSNNIDVLYIGESSNIMYDENDEDKHRISEILNETCPSLRVEDLSLKASHAGIFKVLLNAVPSSKKIKTIVVTMNLRSFGSAWIHSKLETPLQKEMVMLRDEPPYLKRFYLSFKAYNSKSIDVRRNDMLNQWEQDQLKFPYAFPHSTTSEWDEAMAATGKIIDGTLDKQTDLACSYIKAYAFQIDTLSNPRVQDFNQIIELADRRGWNLVFNILAENVEKAKELVGKDLVYLMNYNRQLLVDYYSRKGVTMVDNLNSIENKYFIDQDWTTEHYTEEGRSLIAAKLKDALRSFHKLSD